MSEMKKVGLSIAYKKNHNNYGTALLGFATVKMVESLGYEYEVIRYEKTRDLLQSLMLAPLRLMSGGVKTLKNRVRTRSDLKKYPEFSRGIAQRTAAVNKYKSKYIDPYCRTYIGYDALSEGSKNYSVVMVGSDQVWLPLGLYTKLFNLLFVDDSIPKVAYSSSFGVSQIPWWQKKQTRNYLNRFDLICVREVRGKQIVEELSDKEATVVLDPTLMVSAEQWHHEADQSDKKIEGDYIFCYFLGSNQESRKAVNELRERTGMKVVSMPHMDEYVAEDEDFADYAPYDISPNDFISLLRGAQYVCTDSFHATIFSLKFEKKFLTYYRFDSKSKNSRNSRIDSLFGLLKLEDRLYRGDDVYSQISKSVPYAEVNATLNTLREHSFECLSKGLKLGAVDL